MQNNNNNFNPNSFSHFSEPEGILNYFDFCDSIVSKVTERLGSDYMITRGSIKKNNGVSYDAMTLLKVGSSIAPNIYLNELYRIYDQGESVDSIADSIVYDTLNRFSKVSFCGLMTEDGPSFEDVKDNIFFTLINAKRNEELLNDIAWIPYEDLAIVFRFLVHEDESGESGSVLISNALCNLWGITLSQLKDLAFKNTPRLFPPKIAKMVDILLEKLIRDNRPKDEIDALRQNLDAPIYVVTNTQSLNGASVLLYEGIREDLYKLLGSEYYILPSSIHELLAVPQNEASRETLENMVSKVNSTDIDPVDILSDRVYSYPN